MEHAGDPFMKAELQLTPTQQQHLDSLLTDAQARVRASSREVGPRFRAIVAETRTDLRAILTPEQREQLRAIRRERQILRRERLDELRRRGFDIPDSTDLTESRTRGP